MNSIVFDGRWDSLSYQRILKKNFIYFCCTLISFSSFAAAGCCML